MKKILAAGFVVLALSSCKITEDMPGWNCKTMGNKICGPVDIGEPLVIEPTEEVSTGL